MPLDDSQRVIKTGYNKNEAYTQLGHLKKNLKKVQILLVEDDSSMRLMLAMSLARPDREIITAIDGIDALASFQYNHGMFDAIITDNDMPNMHGVELVTSLRQAGFQGRIIVMSGGMTQDKLNKYREQKICSFFPKPLDLPALNQILDSSNSIHD